jgi:hypothetical protein
MEVDANDGKDTPPERGTTPSIEAYGSPVGSGG